MGYFPVISSNIIFWAFIFFSPIQSFVSLSSLEILADRLYAPIGVGPALQHSLKYSIAKNHTPKPWNQKNITYSHKITKGNQRHPNDTDMKYTKSEHQTNKTKTKY